MKLVDVKDQVELDIENWKEAAKGWRKEAREMQEALDAGHIKNHLKATAKRDVQLAIKIAGNCDARVSVLENVLSMLETVEQ